MNMLFHKMRTGKKGQLVAMLTVALVIFVIAAFLVVNLGKNKIQDNKLKNASQAGVLAGGSAACILLNSMANINDQMILNFVGFTIMMQFLLISWIIDYVKVIVAAFSSLEAFNVTSGPETVLAVMTLCLTTATMALMIIGATKVGNAINKMIDEVNVKLPKNSRDSARQYAFSNVGVDEPKIPFSKSGCSDVSCYLAIETKFDEFMRLLPATNRADLNYGTSTMAFDWNDSRTEQIVNNKIEVIVSPVPQVPFRLMKFSDVSGESSAIISYLNSQPTGALAPLITWGVTTASMIIAMIWSTAVLIEVLAACLVVISVIEYIWAAVYWGICTGCSWAYCACCWACPFGAYYDWAATYMAIAATIADMAAWSFFFIYSSYPPGDIPCFVWEQRTEHPLQVQVSRTTTPPSINYGFYRTDWPLLSQTATGAVKDGSIFPPNQNFDIIPNF
jgi:hypothetical protein